MAVLTRIKIGPAYKKQGMHMFLIKGVIVKVASETV